MKKAKKDRKPRKRKPKDNLVNALQQALLDMDLYGCAAVKVEDKPNEGKKQTVSG